MDSCGVFDGVESRLHKVLVDCFGIVVFGPAVEQRPCSHKSSSEAHNCASFSNQSSSAVPGNVLSVLSPGVESKSMSARS